MTESVSPGSSNWVTVSKNKLCGSYGTIPETDLCYACLWLLTIYTHVHTHIHTFKNKFLKFYCVVLKHRLCRRQHCVPMSKGQPLLAESKHWLTLTASSLWEYSFYIPKHAGRFWSHPNLMTSTYFQYLDEYAISSCSWVHMVALLELRECWWKTWAHCSYTAA